MVVEAIQEVADTNAINADATSGISVAGTADPLPVNSVSNAAPIEGGPPGLSFSEKLAAGPVNFIVGIMLALFLFLFLWFRNLEFVLNDKLADP